MIKTIEHDQWTGSFLYNKDEIEKILLFSCSFSIMLLALRIIITGSLMYGFLAWNLFLACIPYIITKQLTQLERVKTTGLNFIVLFLLWLIFIPNAFYIITDLFHLNEGKAAPQWFNLVLIFSFAWNGLLLGIISFRKMEKIMEQFISGKWRWVFLFGIMWLNALGIYIGRYLRFNSWDVITNPFELANDIIYLCIHPRRKINEWGMIVSFTVLMTLVYQSIKKISQLVFK
jgi:uncharacterized membrane protein